MRKNIAFIAILVGLFDSIYLTWAYTSQAHSMVCLGTGCDVVRSSPYAYPFGIPLPIGGVLLYLLLAVLALLEVHRPKRGNAIWRWIMIFSGAGVLFSAWLTYLEAFVIHGWCAWCVVQAIAVTLVFAMAVSVVFSQTTERAPSKRAHYAMLAVAVVVSVPALLLLARKQESAPAQPADTAGVTVGDAGQLIRPDSHWTGNPNAKLTIVEFADFQCPSCGVAERTNRAIRDQFGDQVKFVFRQFPLERIHAYAFQAAKASECAGAQDKFWPMAEKLYANQTQLTAPDLRRYAAELGLDQEKFNACLEDPAMSRRIRVDMADANALDVRATPSFFLNGKKHEGPLTMMDVTAALSAASKAPAPATAPPQEKPANPATKSMAGAEKKEPSQALPQAGTAPENSKTAAKPGVVQSPESASAGAIGFGTPGGGNPFGTPNASSAIVPCGVNEKPVNDPPMIQTAEMQKLFDNKAAIFVDVRGSGAYKESHIPTAINATLDQLEKRIPPQLPKDKQIVLYEAGGADESCTASKTAGRILMQNGFKDVKVFKQGFEGWKQRGLPVAR